MALGQKLQLRQSQSLVMTPQLLQSIRLLQLPYAELERFVEEEIERNPLLERSEIGDDAVTPERNEETPQATGPTEADWCSNALGDSDEISERLGTSLENVFPDDPGRPDGFAADLSAQWRSAPGATTGSHERGAGFNLEELAAGAVTLRDHVGEQIALAFAGGPERIIATELADTLDEAGYMRGDLAEIADRLGVDEAMVLRVLSACQEFDPPGLFARDLGECLALQLRVRNRFDPAMAAMIANLEMLAQRDFVRLRQICGVDREDLLDMMAEIKALDPKPGLMFSVGTATTIVPDVIVTAAPDGSWAVELNSETLPKVLVDQAYYARIARRTSDPAEKEFLAGCLQNANWLTRSLDQRARTILKVASEIVRRQDAFLVHGVRQLKPLNLRTVAEAIGMHESTVSRVSANKYMLTPRGVFELRYFYTVAIPASHGGDAHSSESVRLHIRDLIKAETARNVLSDDAIVDALKKGGIDIARRTVAKYRETMHIPSSIQRRREKRAISAAET
jgi:RNA polymerase sigma-54 factor